MYSAVAALLLASAMPMASAQTYTSCNPLDTTCPSDPAMGASLTSDFTSGAQDGWTVIAGSINYGSTGAEFTVAAEGDAPTIQTTDYFFWGTAEVKMQAAPGRGIVSSIVFESDDLDELDWEALGTVTEIIETDYFGKGYTGSYDRSTNASVSSPQTSFHTYTINWQKDSIQWLIDGSVVRTLTPAEAGDHYPQTPMRLRIGIWAGGDPKNAPGTIAWAGGETDYSAGPFNMYVESVTITNDNPASSYTYGDKSGSADSIVINGASSAPTTSSVASTTSTSSSSSSASSSSSSSSSSDSSSGSSSSSTSSVVETTSSVAPSTTSSTGSTTSSAPSTTLTSITTPVPITVSSNSTPTGTNTSATGGATGTNTGSSTSTATSTKAPQVGAAMRSVASPMVALYCFLFAMVAYAL